MARPEGHNVLPETTRPIYLIFGMQHHIVDFYQVCSNYVPWTKMPLIRDHLDLYRL